MGSSSPQAPASASGTGLDSMLLSAPLGFDSAYANELFSGVRINQPSEATQVYNPGIDAHTITIWGTGTRIFDSSFAGKATPDATIPRGVTTLSPAQADWQFSLKPQRGYNFAFYVDPRCYRDLFEDDHPAGRTPELKNTPASTDPFFGRMMHAYLSEMKQAREFSALALQSIALQVSLHLARNYSTLVERDSPTGRSLMERERIERAKSYIHDNLQRPISLSEIAGAACLSQYHFVRCFKASEGVTPYQYVIQQRVERAHSLVIGSAHSLAEISILCGFSSQQHLTDAFRKAFSTTPGALRKG